MPFHSDLERRFAAAVDAAAPWRLTRVWQERECLCLDVDAPPEASLVLEVRAARVGVQAYRVVEGLAFGYRLGGRSLPRAELGRLDRAVAALAAALAKVGFDPSRDTLPAAEGEDIPPFPTPYHRSHLESEVALPPGDIAAFRRDGHVLVRRALGRDVVLAARPYVLAALQRAWPVGLPPVDERPDAYSRSFTQITDLGLNDRAVAALSHARRLARMAADLMGVPGVRVFCEDWLVKEPGARITPWHQDEAVFPFDAPASVTCWIPLQDVRAGDGLLRFARGSHRSGVAPIEDINDVSEEGFARIIAERGFPLDDLPPVQGGDVSFHHGRTIHGAYPNQSSASRVVLALHCFADGARLKEPTTPKMARLFAGAAPGRAAGEPAASERWPVVYGRDAAAPAARVGPGGRLHLRATRLPEGDPVDLWIEDGRLVPGPLTGARELAAPGGFVTAGLVDCHSHISYPHERGDPADTPRWMNARRAEYAATGVLALRDMGAAGDAVSALTDVPGLPRVHACGTMIVRHDEFPFTRTEPADLTRACVERIERGARWVKVFADWSGDYRGRVNSGFTGDDEVTYPLALLAEAVAAVHALGGRVAAHGFTRAGAEVALRAGVDSLEHGWGLDEGLLAEAAARGVAWVPLVGIAPSMWRAARRDGEADRAAWVERAVDSLARLLPLAEARGVRLLAGTDLFPEVTVGDEVRQLCELGVSAPTAVAAASWAARAWLGEPGLEAGAPADLALYRSDPRADPSALLRPELIVLGGEVVAPSLAHVRPRHFTWAERWQSLAAPG